MRRRWSALWYWRRSNFGLVVLPAARPKMAACPRRRQKWRQSKMVRLSLNVGMPAGPPAGRPGPLLYGGIMDSRILTITSGKGGVGKTTTAANLSTALAMMGHRVAAVDGDIGLRNLDAVMGLESHIIYDLVDVVEGQCQLNQALRS